MIKMQIKLHLQAKVTTARGTHTKEVLFPDKSLKLSYKVNVANIDTPKNIDFNEN